MKSYEDQIDSMCSMLMPTGVVCAVAPPKPKDAYLYPEEYLYVAGAPSHRRIEFATGRTLARLALKKLGVSAQPIKRDADRRPIWPENIVGSITHCKGLAFVAVANQQVARSLGIDAEIRLPLEERLIQRICTKREIACNTKSSIDKECWPRLLFSAKESVYKNVSSLFGTSLLFQDLSIIPEIKDGSFRVIPESQRAHSLPWRQFSGRYAITDSHIITAGSFKGSKE